MIDVLRAKASQVGRGCVIVLFVLVMLLLSAIINAEVKSAIAVSPQVTELQTNESLTYSVSWSNLITAGIAILKVESESLPEGGSALSFVINGYSTGVVEKLYHVHDIAQSMFDPLIGQSLSYNIKEVYGMKHRRRELTFDSAHGTVISKLNDDAAETLPVPVHVLDPLSALYVLRMTNNFTIGKNMVLSVFESGKNWSVEIQVLGREKVLTPAGAFNAIKLRTYPRYEGVFLNKGVVFIWLSDDNRKIPVLIKSSLKVGSFVLTLTERKLGGETR